MELVVWAVQPHRLAVTPRSPQSSWPVAVKAGLSPNQAAALVEPFSLVPEVLVEGVVTEAHFLALGAVVALVAIQELAVPLETTLEARPTGSMVPVVLVVAVVLSFQAATTPLEEAEQASSAKEQTELDRSAPTEALHP